MQNGRTVISVRLVYGVKCEQEKTCVCHNVEYGFRTHHFERDCLVEAVLAKCEVNDSLWLKHCRLTLSPLTQLSAAIMTKKKKRLQTPVPPNKLDYVDATGKHHWHRRRGMASE